VNRNRNGHAQQLRMLEETLIYSNQHQSLQLYILNFQVFLDLPLTGESFNQCFLNLCACKARNDESIVAQEK